MRYKQESHNGEHPTIVSQELFDEVQSILDSNGATQVHYKDVERPPLLRGLLRCEPCDTAMVHSFTNRGARRYRYYHCNAAQGRDYAVCPSPIAPAPELEQFVVDQIRGLAADPDLATLLAARDASDDDPDEATIHSESVKLAVDWFSTSWESWSPREQANRLQDLVRTVLYDGQAGEIEVALKADGVRALLTEAPVAEPSA